MVQRSVPLYVIYGITVVYKSKVLKVNIFAVGDQMEERGWYIDRRQRPDGLHAMVTPLHRRIVFVSSSINIFYMAQLCRDAVCLW